MAGPVQAIHGLIAATRRGCPRAQTSLRSLRKLDCGAGMTSVVIGGGGCDLVMSIKISGGNAMTPEQVLSHPARVLAQKQRESYFANGYLLVENAVPSEWV